jgi:hypothetical protein
VIWGTSSIWAGRPSANPTKWVRWVLCGSEDPTMNGGAPQSSRHPRLLLRLPGPPRRAGEGQGNHTQCASQLTMGSLCSGKRRPGFLLSGLLINPCIWGMLRLRSAWQIVSCCLSSHPERSRRVLEGTIDFFNRPFRRNDMKGREWHVEARRIVVHVGRVPRRLDEKPDIRQSACASTVSGFCTHFVRSGTRPTVTRTNPPGHGGPPVESQATSRRRKTGTPLM